MIHLFHIEKMGRIGGEIVLNALLVAYVNHDGVEHTHGAVLPHWHAKAALHHVLQQTDSLKTYGLTASIRA